MFTFNQVRIADAWGTTNLPLEAPLPGSLLLVVGDQSRSHMWQFLLIVHHFRLRIFHLFSHCSFKERRSKYLYHRYTPYWWTSHPADSESECGSQSRQAWKTNSWTESFCYHGDCGQGPHCLFPDGKAYWAFQRQTETLNTSMQFSEVTADSICMAWMNFRIPFEFPPIMDHFISFDENHSHPVKDESINALPKMSNIPDWTLPDVTSTLHPAPSRNWLIPSVLAEKRRHDDEPVRAGGSERQNKCHLK